MISVVMSYSNCTVLWYRRWKQ